MLLGENEILISTLTRAHWLETEMRVQINEARVDLYADLIRAGTDLGVPIVFIEPPSEQFYVGDGFHRILAHRRAGKSIIKIDLRRGTMRDAWMFNISANRRSTGLPFGYGDFKKCIVMLFQDPEAKEWPLVRISELVGCSPDYVSNVVRRCGLERPEKVASSSGHMHPTRHAHPEPKPPEVKAKAIQLREEGRTAPEVAEELNIHPKTVYGWEREPKTVACPHCHGSGRIPDPAA